MDEIDILLTAVENHTRREILRKLAEGRQYALRMAKELQLSQQAIMKHLDVLEKMSIVRCRGEERSSRGPPRKIYEMAKKFSLFIDIGPGLFEIREYDLDDIESDVEMEDYIEKHDIGESLEKIEREIREIEKRRLQLLKLKEEIISQLFNYE